ncbi:unnamed protein product [[Candida] boidinii]|uniref:Unnamed protein product n=1 Tax=Candida boidinii TaxID=5477 RepID=A0ACB5TMC4_CANBO|nr:unnamed protein product [[Candida] boidinii]
MPGEIITLQVGQCGNQVGEQFWSQISKEHGISMQDQGKRDIEPNEYTDDLPDVFFQKLDDERYTPRAILIDFEPRVVNGINNRYNNFFNPNNLFISGDGGGASNNWTQGYNLGNTHKDEIMDMVNKELDKCDSFEGFQMIHSVAGGTGSGCGSFLLEELNDMFDKNLITTYSVFPRMGVSSEVVVQPYNQILSLKRLIESSDVNIVFDNASLTSIASNNLKTDSPSYEDCNQLISTVMSGLTNTLRFPNYSYSSLTSIFSTLIPTPDLQFLIPSFTPFTKDYVSNPKDIRRSNSYDVIVDILDKKLRMFGNDITQGANSGMYLSILDILIGDNVEQNDIQKALIKARSRVQFVPWSSSAINLSIGNRSPFLNRSQFHNSVIQKQHQQNHLQQQQQQQQVSGLMLSNTTSINNLFNKILKDYDSFMKRGAYLNWYQNKEFEKLNGDIMAEFSDSREIFHKVIQEYKNCESISYLDDDEDDDVDLEEYN